MTIEQKDHERIWLQNAADADECEGRMWCQDKVWPDDHEDSEPTEYVRADLYHDLLSEIERFREALKRIERTAKDRSEKAWFRLDMIADEAHYASRALNDRTSKEGDHG